MCQLLKKIKSPCTIMLLLALSGKVCALQSDGQQKLHISSDSAIYNYKTGINVFEGNVKVDQGSTHLTADRLITKNDHQYKIQEATAYGLKNPAHYWTTPKEGDSEIHAYANLIKYYPNDSNVVLQDHVTVTQDKNSFQGQMILYNMHDETITVPASKKGRAFILYNPE